MLFFYSPVCHSFAPDLMNKQRNHILVPREVALMNVFKTVVLVSTILSFPTAKKSYFSLYKFSAWSLGWCTKDFLFF